MYRPWRGRPAYGQEPPGGRLTQPHVHPLLTDSRGPAVRGCVAGGMTSFRHFLPYITPPGPNFILLDLIIPSSLFLFFRLFSFPLCSALSWIYCIILRIPSSNHPVPPSFPCRHFCLLLIFHVSSFFQTTDFPLRFCWCNFPMIFLLLGTAHNSELFSPPLLHIRPSSLSLSLSYISLFPFLRHLWFFLFIFSPSDRITCHWYSFFFSSFLSFLFAPFPHTLTFFFIPSRNNFLHFFIYFFLIDVHPFASIISFFYRLPPYSFRPLLINSSSTLNFHF